MAETWEDLVTPVRRDENAMANYGQGYVSPALNSGDGEIYDTSNVLARMPQDTAVTRGMRWAADRLRSSLPTRDVATPVSTLTGRETGLQARQEPHNIPLLANAMLEMPAGGIDAAANWLDLSPKVGPDTLAPLGGAVLGTLVSPRNAVGIFGGRLAQTADQGALRRAEEMATSGADRRAIWDETGWFQGADGQWRFEIDDSAARVAPSLSESFERGGGGLVRQGETVGGGFSHPNFMAAYPDAASLGYEVRRMEGPGGGSYAQPQSAMPEGRVLARNSNLEGVRSTTLHELQHDVQRREDFGRGSSPATEAAGMQSANPLTASDNYRRVSGEVEARNVQTRQDMTADERRARPPWETQDVADESQIIRRTATEQRSEPAPSPVTQERALALLEEMGAKVTQVKNVRGTTYIKFEDPAQPHLPFQAQPTIRIPADQHAGRPPRPGEAGVLFDTASQPGRGPVNPLTATDEAGRPYADFNVLESTLRRRFGREQEPNSPPRPQGPDNSPDQPRLLSVAAPAAAGWTATVTQEPPEMAARESEDQGNAGRFAAPLVSPDAQLAADTRSLSDRVSVATRNVESDFDWSDLVVPVTRHAMAGIRRAHNAMMEAQ